MVRNLLTIIFLLLATVVYSQDTLLWENFSSASALDDNTLTSGNWVYGIDAPTGNPANQRGNRWAISTGQISGNSLGVVSRMQNGTWNTAYNGNNPAAITARTPLIDATLYQNVTVTFKWRAVGEAAYSGLPIYDYGMFGYSLTGTEAGTTYLGTGGHPAYNDGYYETSSQNHYLNFGIQTHTTTINLNNLLSGTQFYLHFRWINDNSAAGPVSFHIDDILITGTYVSPLPVTLKELEASCDELLWATESEINNKGFTIEESVDLAQWKVLGFVMGHGSTNEQKEYSFPIKPKGYTYYRIIQEDFDGTKETFGPVSTPFCSEDNGIYVYGDMVYGPGKLEIFDMSGKKVGIGNKNISLLQLASGIYIVRDLESGAALKFFKK